MSILADGLLGLYFMGSNTTQGCHGQGPKALPVRDAKDILGFSESAYDRGKGKDSRSRDSGPEPFSCHSPKLDQYQAPGSSTNPLRTGLL